MDGLTQDGMAYCGVGHAGASNAEWSEADINEQSESGSREFSSYLGRAGNSSRKQTLAETIEAEIIPRLMMLHRAAEAEPAALESRSSDQIDLGQSVLLCDLLLHKSLRSCAEFVDQLLAREIALDAIYLGLFAPTARRLGEMWEADLCGFADVTIGLGRLQQLMHSLSPVFHQEPQWHSTSRRALLLGVPGEQHTLGLFMVSEFFRRAGWEVWNEPASSQEALFAMIGAESFDVIGLSAGSSTKIGLIAAVVAGVRRYSMNQDIAVMVGGPLFIAAPELVAEVGADAMAGDARSAVELAERLVGQRLEK